MDMSSLVVNVNNVPILMFYENYIKNKYIVNRRYQRKLVWSTSSKRKFIDSLVNGFPIPLILCVENKDAQYEILDGMQRLNAIASFLEGDYDFEGFYFDLDQNPSLKQKKDEGVLIQKQPILDKDKCLSILKYPIPVSISTHVSELDIIDESFRRINTGGVSLSKQEVRQAGALCHFSQLVRECSYFVRGDTSHSSILRLNDMKHISLTKEKDSEYGINLSDCFLSKHNIITYQNMMASRDEELVGQILLAMITDGESETTSYYLDSVYSDIEKKSEILNKINRYGYEKIKKDFEKVYEEIIRISNNIPNETKLMTWFYKDRPNHSTRAFTVFFLALYDLIILQNRSIQNYRAVVNKIQNIASKTYDHLINSRKKWDKSDRNHLIRSTVGIISDEFIENIGIDASNHSGIKKLENILNQSRTESVSYDFKIGFYTMHDGEDQALNISDKINTLLAMCNANKGVNWLIIGVADKEKDNVRHNTFYKSDSKVYNGFYITGIEDEATKFCKDLGAYEQKIKQLISKEPISDFAKLNILQNIQFIQYYDRHVLMLSLSRDNEPYTYDEKLYTRQSSHNYELKDPKEIMSFYKLFEVV